MDKVWDGNASKLEVIGHCVGDGKNPMTTQNQQFKAKSFFTSHG